MGGWVGGVTWVGDKKDLEPVGKRERPVLFGVRGGLLDLALYVWMGSRVGMWVCGG